jgi:glycosyltransferase involved in cell wall biosynthesis
VSSVEDYGTNNLCRKYKIKIFNTDRFHYKFNFNKEAAMNEAYSFVSKDRLVLCLDADIILPDNFNKIINSITDFGNIIYGAHRHLCRNEEEYKQFILNKNAEEFELDKKADSPFGFFQMFYPALCNNIYGKLYDEEVGINSIEIGSKIIEKEKWEYVIENNLMEKLLANPDSKFLNSFKKNAMLDLHLLHIGEYGEDNWWGRENYDIFKKNISKV